MTKRDKKIRPAAKQAVFFFKNNEISFKHKRSRITLEDGVGYLSYLYGVSQNSYVVELALYLLDQRILRREAKRHDNNVEVGAYRFAGLNVFADYPRVGYFL